MRYDQYCLTCVTAWLTAVNNVGLGLQQRDYFSNVPENVRMSFVYLCSSVCLYTQRHRASIELNCQVNGTDDTSCATQDGREVKLCAVCSTRLHSG